MKKKVIWMLSFVLYYYRNKRNTYKLSWLVKESFHMDSMQPQVNEDILQFASV